MIATYLVIKGASREKKKSWLNCQRVFLLLPLQEQAWKGLPGRVLRGTSLADGSVSMGRDNPEPGGRLGP